MALGKTIVLRQAAFVRTGCLLAVETKLIETTIGILRRRTERFGPRSSEIVPEHVQTPWSRDEGRG